eukprot:1940999-Alexandrium_andersonii.AAC.1
MAHGRAPSEMQEWLCGASPAALPKPAGRRRPVAAGETRRRLAGKALALAAGRDLRAHLEPLQLGAGTPGGAEPT